MSRKYNQMQTQSQIVELEIYAIYEAQTIKSKEGDTSTWSFLATDSGNVWFNSTKELDASIKVGEVVEVKVYKYLPGTHNTRSGRKNKNFNVYLDNRHLS